MKKVRTLDQARVNELFHSAKSTITVRDFNSYLDLALHNMARSSLLGLEMEEIQTLAKFRKENNSVDIPNVINAAAVALNKDSLIESPIARDRIVKDRNTMIYGIRLDEPGSSVKKMTHFLAAHLDNRAPISKSFLAVLNQIFMMGSQSYRAEAMAQMINLPFDKECYLEKLTFSPDSLEDLVNMYAYHRSRNFFAGFASKVKNKYTALTNYDVSNFNLPVVSRTSKFKSIDTIDNIMTHVFKARFNLNQPVNTYVATVFPELLKIKANFILTKKNYSGMESKYQPVIDMANKININDEYVISLIGDKIEYKPFMNGKFVHQSDEPLLQSDQQIFFDQDVLKHSIIDYQEVKSLMDDFIEFINLLFNNKHQWFELTELTNTIQIEKVQEDEKAYQSTIRHNGRQTVAMNRRTSLDISIPGYNPFRVSKLGLYLILPHTFVSETNTRKCVMSDYVTPISEITNWARSEFTEFINNPSVYFDDYQWNYRRLAKYFDIQRSDEVGSLIAILKEKAPAGIKDIRDGLSNISIVLNGAVREVQAIDILDPNGKINPDIAIPHLTNDDTTTQMNITEPIHYTDDKSTVVRSIDSNSLIDLEKLVHEILTFDQFMALLLTNTPIRLRCQQWCDEKANEKENLATDQKDKKKIKRFNINDDRYLAKVLKQYQESELTGLDQSFYEDVYQAITVRDLLQIVFALPRGLARISNLQSTFGSSEDRLGLSLFNILTDIESQLSTIVDEQNTDQTNINFNNLNDGSEIIIPSAVGKLFIKNFAIFDTIKALRLSRRRMKFNYYRSLINTVGIDINFISECFFEATGVTTTYQDVTYKLMDLLDKVELMPHEQAIAVTDTITNHDKLAKFGAIATALKASHLLLEYIFGVEFPAELDVDAKDVQNVISGQIQFM